LYRVVVNIAEYLHELPQSLDDPRKKAGTPYMPGTVSGPIVGHGENAHDPAHDRREALAFSWQDYEMEMVSHDAEIFYLESVFESGSFDDRKEEVFHQCRFEDHFFSVRPGGDMIPGAILEESWSSHTLYSSWFCAVD
jgi:hypothetical protein